MRSPRTAISLFVDLGDCSAPPEVFDMAALLGTVEKLRAAAIPPMTCSACGAGYYFLIEGNRPLPTHWRCDKCDRVHRRVGWKPGEAGCIAMNVGNAVVLNADRATPI